MLERTARKGVLVICENPQAYSLFILKMLIEKLAIFSCLCILDLIVNGTVNIREVNGIDIGELTKYYLGSENSPLPKTILIEVGN